MGNQSKEYLAKALYEAVLELESLEECRAFFRDLCTPAEIKAMGERWEVAQVLSRKDRPSYRKIHEITGASIVTIGRVARFLNEEEYGGYQLVLNRMEEKEASLSNE